jgi:hypothetical protein
LAFVNDRPVCRLVDAENRDLGVVDDRRRANAAVAAQARDREGGIRQLIAGD